MKIFYSGWVGFSPLDEIEKFPPKILNFSIFFPLGQIKSHRVESKNTQVMDGLASYLLRAWSMLRLGQVRAPL